MRDVRFHLDAAVSLRDEAVRHGSGMESAPWFDDAVRTISAWLIERLQPDATIDSENLWILPDAALQASLLRVENLPDNPRRTILSWPKSDLNDEDQPGADWVWGAALAEAAVSCASSFEVFQHCQRMAGLRGFTVGQSFLEGCANDLAKPQLRLYTILREVAERARGLRGCTMFLGAVERFAQVLDGWRETARLSDVWSLRNLEESGIRCDDAWLLDALRLRDRRHYLRLLEDTRNPLVIQDAFRAPSVEEDIAEICQLLAVAPSAVSQTGGLPSTPKWNGNLTALLVLQAALRHAERLVQLVLHPYRNPPADLEEVIGLRSDLEVGFHSLMAILLSRDDGVFIAAYWTLHLAHVVTREACRTPLTAANVALQMAARTLVRDSGTDPDGFEEIVATCDDAASALDRLTARMALRAERDQSGGASAGGTGGFEELIEVLGQSAAELSRVRSAFPPTWAHVYAALPLVWDSAPDSAWAAAWSRLSSPRQMMLHNADLGHLSADEPSLFLVYAGMAMLDLDHPRIPGGQTSERLWDHLFDASLSMIARMGSWHQKFSAKRWREAMVLLWQQLPTVTQYSSGSAPSVDRLSDLLRRLGGDVALVLDSVAVLHRSGLSAAELVEATDQTGSKMEDLIARYTRFVEQHRIVTSVCAFDAMNECRALLREARTS
jgi:hypothetical protein